MALYQVIGTHDFREHAPGETFEARLDPASERRALARGNIVVLDSSPTRLRPGSFRLPDGWQTAFNGAAEAALSIEGGH